jgi:lipopolysaccharide export system permease protein
LSSRYARVAINFPGTKNKNTGGFSHQTPWSCLSFAAPDTVGFWHLPTYIRYAEDSGLAAAGYRLQYQALLARPFLQAAMVLLAASFSLRTFRFGGVPQRLLLGSAAGFSIYVLSKVTEDLSKAELLYPLFAAWLPILAGGLFGFLILLHEEDG